MNVPEDVPQRGAGVYRVRCTKVHDGILLLMDRHSAGRGKGPQEVRIHVRARDPIDAKALSEFLDLGGRPSWTVSLTADLAEWSPLPEIR